MRVVICWAGYSGYLAACWRSLSHQLGSDLSVFAEKTKYPYTDDVLDGLPVYLIGEPTDAELEKVINRINAFGPDIILVSGWTTPFFRKLVARVRNPKFRFVLAMDTPWRGDFRQHIARFCLYPYLKRFAGVIVSGERGRQYALKLGFRDSEICTGVYGFDYNSFSTVLDVRKRGTWPRSFSFVGRLAPEKGLQTLCQAYRKYVAAVSDPWLFYCYGKGPLEKELSAVGMRTPGFVQPKDLPEIFSNVGVFVLPSLYEPWGVVLAEAAASGLPVICSTACCSGSDIVRNFHSGLVFSTGDSDELCRCMIWMHQNYDSLPALGENAQVYAHAYSSELWAKRLLWFLEGILS